MQQEDKYLKQKHWLIITKSYKKIKDVSVVKNSQILLVMLNGHQLGLLVQFSTKQHSQGKT